MKIFSIYKATNRINGKSYIGFAGDFYHRKAGHKTDMKKKRGSYFHEALRKYGWEAFEWEIICQSTDGKYLLEVMEPYFIKQYKSFWKEDGYNLTVGGEGTLGAKHTFSKEHRKNLSKALIGKPIGPMSLEQRKRISETMKGRKQSPEHVQARCKPRGPYGPNPKMSAIMKRSHERRRKYLTLL